MLSLFSGLPWMKLLGKGGLYLGMVVMVAAAGAWLRKDARDDAEAAWQLRLAQETAELVSAKAEADLRVVKLEADLVGAMELARVKDESEAHEVAGQKGDWPLSAECLRCRIPNERIWVRGNARAAAPSVSGSSSAAKRAAPGS